MSQLRSTRSRDLVAPLMVAGVLIYLLLRTHYDSIPPLHYAAPVPLAVLAVAEYLTARRVRAVVRHDPHARPMAAIAIARCVALGKATSLVGAAAVGASLGLLGRVLPDASRVTAAANDSRVGGLLLVSSLALVVAGLALERAGISPTDKTGHPA